MSIADRIKSKRLELGLTQSELAQLVGITQQSLQKIEDGKTQNPRKLYYLAKELKCSAEWLQFGTSESIQEAPSQYNTDCLRPLISIEKVNDWLESVQADSTALSIESWFNVPHTISEKAFWLKVVGDSMTSPSGISIPEGYYILIEPDQVAKNGDLVIAKLNQSDEITFKKFIIDSGRTYLKPLNPDYSSIDVTENINILGVVKESRLIL